MKTGSPVFASLALWVVMDAAPVIDFTDPNEVDAQLTALYDSVESNLDREVCYLKCIVLK